jgi:co-chaperonin GroES (HSP10)|tara:strand:+ start:364 stop:618 length:255 start_codon:yes stop_codon:yes gene_type:complete
MQAVGNYIIIDEITEASTKTEGGLELGEKHREDIRYRKGIIISSGPDIMEKGQEILYDRVAGFPTEFNDNVYKVIQLRDIVAIL